MFPRKARPFLGLRSSSATGVIWALWAQSPETVREWVPGRLGLRGRKSRKKESKKSTSSQLCALFRLFRLPEMPREPIFGPFWTLSPRGPNDPVTGEEDRKTGPHFTQMPNLVQKKNTMTQTANTHGEPRNDQSCEGPYKDLPRSPLVCIQLEGSRKKRSIE